MRKTFLIITLCIFLFSSTATAQMLSPVFSMQGVLEDETKPLFIGKSKISGSFQGYDLDSFSSNPFISKVKASPLFGSAQFYDIDNVVVFDNAEIDLFSINDIDDIIEGYGSEFSDVTIIAENGPFLLGSEDGFINVNTQLSYAISSILTLDVDEVSNQFFVVATRSDMNTHYIGGISYLVQNTNSSSIRIEDSSGSTVWSGSSTENILIIEDEDYYFVQNSAAYLFPLIDDQSYTDFKITISPAESNDLDLISLIDDVIDSASDFGDISDIAERIQDFKSIISTVSPIINGGVIFIESKDTLSIDGSSQTFSNVGFARANSCSITLDSETNAPHISGDFRLIFLGDHFYTAQAQNSENGVAFPFILVIIWIIALVLFFLFRFYLNILHPILLKKDIDEKLDTTMKKYALYFHIITLVITFILLDREISFQFGMSALDAVFSQGVSLVLLAFVIVELIMWVLGYIALAIPLRIFMNSFLRVIGIGKGGKGIGKGVGAFGMWIFCAMYVKLIINVIFLVLNPSSLFTMG